MTTDAFIAKLKENICKDEKNKPCMKPTREKIIDLKDGESSALQIRNDKQKEIYKVKMDGCFVWDSPKKSTLSSRSKKNKPPKDPKRCDWVLYSKEHKKIFFIELKRYSGIPKCVKQFASSIKIFNNDEVISCCVLVPLTNKDISRLEKEIKNHGLKFKVMMAEPHDNPIATTTLNALLNAPEFAN